MFATKPDRKYCNIFHFMLHNEIYVQTIFLRTDIIQIHHL